MKVATTTETGEAPPGKVRRLSACGQPACDETNFAFRNLPKRFDHELLLSCPYSGLQIVEGIAPKHRHPALTHDGAGVVVSIYQIQPSIALLRAAGAVTYESYVEVVYDE